jgi:hypothetical protein
MSSDRIAEEASVRKATGRGRLHRGSDDEIPDDKCLRMGDFVVFSSVEEDERGFLATSAVSEDLCVVHPGSKTKSSLSFSLSLSLSFLHLTAHSP